MKTIQERLDWLQDEGFVELELSAEAFSIWEKYYKTLRKGDEEYPDISNRLESYGFRLMLLLTISSENYKDGMISESTVSKVIKILEWEKEIRKIYKPVDAENTIAKLEIKIKNYINISKGKILYRDLQRKINAQRYGSFYVRTAISNLIRDGQILEKQVGKTYVYSISNCHHFCHHKLDDS
ncbi:MAG: hypothetical protein AB9903_23390 [Vulcanimicrobiota bacterium]